MPKNDKLAIELDTEKNLTTETKNVWNQGLLLNDALSPFRVVARNQWRDQEFF